MLFLSSAYEDIPGLLRKTLQEKNQDDDVTESQMRVLDKLIQGKKGKTEDAGGPAKEREWRCSEAAGS